MIHRVHKTKDYTVISNYHLRDKNLSLKAKGLLSLMLTLPDDWDFNVRGLATLTAESKDTVNRICQELVEHGYIVRTQVADSTGKFQKTVYDVYEKPRLENQDTENPVLEKPRLDNPCPQNPYTENCDKPNTIYNQYTEQPITEQSNTDGNILFPPLSPQFDEFDFFKSKFEIVYE